MILNMLERLQLKDAKNLLIQGLPSSIEKQFLKLSFAKNVTPLLKSRKIDFALAFAINQKQLNGILNDILPALQKEGKLWIAYPKKASKIVTDLDKLSSWDVLAKAEFKSSTEVVLDHVWTAVRYKKIGDTTDEEVEENETEDEDTPKIKVEKKVVNITENITIPIELEEAFVKNKLAKKAFDKLAVVNQKEFAEWIGGAKKDITKQKRLKDTIDKLLAGKKNPSEK
jgi:Bacteriocin-protection, YdeI or OmpD-Associated